MISAVADTIGRYFIKDIIKVFEIEIKVYPNLDYHFLPNGQLVLAYGGRNISIRVAHMCIQMERVLEIKLLQEAVEKEKIDKSAFDTEKDIKQDYHDQQIKVKFSKSAAKVLKLIEEFKYDLKMYILPF